MSWDVEPFNNNQVPFFSAVDAILTKCGKRWNVFAFGEHFSKETWTDGLGESGFLLHSTYDLAGGRPCDCVETNLYEERLVDSLEKVRSAASKYGKRVMPLFSGGGSTQTYTETASDQCLFADGTVHQRQCPHSMVSYAQTARRAVHAVELAFEAESSATLFPFGAGIYPYATTDNGGFAPSTPSQDTIKELFMI